MPFTLLFLVVLPLEAHAYLDPGIGSVILQGLMGGGLVILYTGKAYWRRLLSFFGVKSRKHEIFEHNQHEKLDDSQDEKPTMQD